MPKERERFVRLVVGIVRGFDGNRLEIDLESVNLPLPLLFCDVRLLLRSRLGFVDDAIAKLAQLLDGQSFERPVCESDDLVAKRRKLGLFPVRLCGRHRRGLELLTFASGNRLEILEKERAKPHVCDGGILPAQPHERDNGGNREEGGDSSIRLSSASFRLTDRLGGEVPSKYVPKRPHS